MDSLCQRVSCSKAIRLFLNVVFFRHGLDSRSMSSISVSDALRLARMLIVGLCLAGLVARLERPTVWAVQDDAGRNQIVPHNQDGVPNEAYNPQEAIQAMSLPDGFQAELVVGEPELVNPIAMTFDERGRLWVTESLEYPRREAGPGRDRIKIFEDTTGDGQFDSVKIFAEGLNIPSGIAVGYGGVWVANSPDLLFMQDLDGDDRADKVEVVVTGFGRDDTHELPNSLTWGPDGYLYGLNGVFNYCTIEQDGKVHKFTCAMFRVDPETRQFEVFAEGTSNPWGIAFDDRGEAFVSACVIDHLWHLSESGYYLRQAGAYPPHTWIIDSIVDHKHFKAAYCGIHYFDSPAYPAEYRKKMVMGNIHGGSINVDEIEPLGSTYRARGNDDLLRANDVWFMPVAQKTGPDGCLYVLDWYDRYHCYQDANRDPQGIDRLKGRLYRIRYQETPRVTGFDLAKLDVAGCVKRLGDPNVFVRETAQRLLSQRLLAQPDNAGLVTALMECIRDESNSTDARRHACWALLSGRAVSADDWKTLSQHADPVIRKFAVRALGDFVQLQRKPERSEQWRTLGATVLPGMAERETQPEVQLALVVALRKVMGRAGLPWMLTTTAATGQDDGLLPRILWQNMLALVLQDETTLDELSELEGFRTHPFVADLAPRSARLLLDRGRVADALSMANRLPSTELGAEACRRVLEVIEQRIVGGELSQERWAEAVTESAVDLMALPNSTVRTRLTALTGDKEKLATLIEVAKDAFQEDAERQAAFSTLIFLSQREASGETLQACLDAAGAILESKGSTGLLQHVIDQLVRLPATAAAPVLARAAQTVEPSIRSRIIEAMTSRPEAAKVLLRSIGEPDQVLTRAMINETQIQRLLVMGDEELLELIATKWGTMQTGNRGLAADEMVRVRRVMREVKGDYNRGWLVYDRVCGQCHQFGGRGEQVGPSLDANGRASLSQLLSNIVDPNLVIGADYQARLVATTDGRVYSGLVLEDTADRLVLNLQGGKTVSIPRAEIDQEQVSPNSLMPEGQTRQLTDQEIADLMSILVLNDPLKRSGSQIPEANVVDQNQWSPDRYAPLLSEVFADFKTEQWMEGGLGLLATHQGRTAVVRTHPASPTQPTVLKRSVKLPAEPQHLRLGLHHHTAGAWKLVVQIDNQPFHTQVVNEDSCEAGWLDLELDLTSFAGREVEINLENHTFQQQFSFAYWSHAYLYPVDAALPEMRSVPAEEMEPQVVDRRKQPPVMPVPKGWVRLAPDYPVFVDLAEKRVIVDGQIVQNQAMLEMLACPVDSGKEHESVVAVYSNSQLIHAALLAVGAKPGSPVKFDPEFKAATGTTIRIEAEWLDENQQPQRINVRRWVRQLQTKKEMQTDWVFGGSIMYKDPDTGREYYLAEGGELVCVSNFATATMDLPTASPADAANQLYEANTDLIPPLGTPVRLYFVPDLSTVPKP
jgi:putative membrane-bound dehydrogenase-like protein